MPSRPSATNATPSAVASELSSISSELASLTSQAASFTDAVSEPTRTSAASITDGSNTVASSAASSAETSLAPQVSIRPTGTNTATAPSIASTMMMQPSSTRALGPETDTAALPSTRPTSTGIPKSMPQIIQPPGGMPAAVPNTTLIQVGFKYGLNYPFVANTAGSADQIFFYLPTGLSWALGLPHKNITMHSLQPYDTTSTLGYITTLAMAYIPSLMVETLSLDIHTAVSRVYTNPDDATSVLMNMINPAIPLIPGSAMGAGNGYGPTGVQDLPLGPTGAGSNPFGDDGTGEQGTVKGTSVGIGVGVVAAAAVYGGAMFFVARRYKRRKQAHKRSSSVMDGQSDMSQVDSGRWMSGQYTRRSANTMSGNYGAMMGSGALMAGALGGGAVGERYRDGAERSSGGSGGSNGRSVREMGISAPMLAENSLAIERHYG